MGNLSKTEQIMKTKHQEYSLLAATFLIVSLPFLFSYFVGNSFLLWLIAFLGIICSIWNIFSVYRHLDVLAHRFSLPYSLILSMGVTNILFIGLVEMLMVANPLANELVLRESVFYMVILLFGGITGLICFISPRQKRKESPMGRLYSYLGLVFVIALLLFILPGSFFEAGFSKLQLVIVMFFCLISYGGMIFYQSQEGNKNLLFEAEDTVRGAFSIGCSSPFSSPWHSGLLIMHLIAFFAIFWVLSPYLKQTVGAVPFSSQWLGLIGSFILICPLGVGMGRYAKEGGSKEAMVLGISSLLGNMSLGIPVTVGIAIWLKQEIVLAFSLPQTILMLNSFLLMGFFSIFFEAENHQRILGIAHFGLLAGALLILC